MKIYEIEDYIHLLQEFEILIAWHPKGLDTLKENLISNPDTEGALDPEFNSSSFEKIDEYLWALNPWIYYHPFLMWKELKKIIINNESDDHLIAIIKEFCCETADYLEKSNPKAIIDDTVVYFNILIFLYIQLSPSRNYNRIIESFYDTKNTKNLLYTRKYQPIKRYLNKFRDYADNNAGKPDVLKNLLHKFRECIGANPTGYDFARLLNYDKFSGSEKKSDVTIIDSEALNICNNVLFAATAMASVKNLNKNSFDGNIFQPVLRDFVNKRVFDEGLFDKLASRKFDFNQYFFNLVNLGHIEYDRNNGNCNICHPQISKISGSGQDVYYLLSGARSPYFIQTLKKEAEKRKGIHFTEELHQNELRLLYPSVVCLKGESAEIGSFVEQFKASHFSETNIIFSSEYLPLRLLEFSIDLSEWGKGINEKINKNLFDPAPSTNCLRRFYDVKTFRFSSQHDHSDYCLVRSEYQKYNVKYYLKYKRNYLNLDFHEIPWAMLYILSTSSVDFIYYDPAKNILAVPRAVRLPDIVVRSLISCSGHLPFSVRPENISVEEEDITKLQNLFINGFEFDRSFSAYKMVPEGFSRSIAMKLGLRNIVRVKIRI